MAARMPPTATPAVVKVAVALGSFGNTLKAIKIEATPAQVDGSFMRAAIYSTIGFIFLLLNNECSKAIKTCDDAFTSPCGTHKYAPRRRPFQWMACQYSVRSIS